MDDLRQWRVLHLQGMEATRKKMVVSFELQVGWIDVFRKFFKF